MTKSDVSLAVVESDQPTTVRMLNSSGCDIGTWDYVEWLVAIAKGDIIIQCGDRFIFEPLD